MGQACETEMLLARRYSATRLPHTSMASKWRERTTVRSPKGIPVWASISQVSAAQMPITDSRPSRHRTEGSPCPWWSFSGRLARGDHHVCRFSSQINIMNW